MRANAQLAFLAERLFPGTSYDELLTSGTVAAESAAAVARVMGSDRAQRIVLTERAVSIMQRSLAEMLAWMRLFRVPDELISRTIDSWVNAQCEMLQRLDADRAEIESCFGANARRVVSVDLGLSDRHSGGRTVAVLDFDSGLKLVYKPRDLAIEAWFSSFLSGCNEWGAPLPLRPLKIVAKEQYGWSEFAAYERCRDGQQLREFYRNAGALLCVLHLLRATDCHFENLIACGTQPVFVDAETLFQPSLLPDDENVSVLRTGMLPRAAPFLGIGTKAADLGALSCVSAQTVPVPIPSSAGEAGRFEAAVLTPETNVPFPEGQEPCPQVYAEVMVDGFCRTWQFLAAHREEALSMLDEARRLPVRYVFRETLHYYQAIVAALCSGGVEGVTLSPFDGPKVVFQPLEEQDKQALRQLDIPRFTLMASGSGIRGVPQCFPVPGWEMSRAAIEGMSDKSMEEQAGLLRVSWGLYGAAMRLKQ